jgi:PPOX class probable FMN-dependent enzyme
VHHDIDDDAPVGGIVRTTEALRALYREPSQLVQRKKRPEIDDASRRFIASSPFLLVATAGADGGVDVSPRGGDPGFVRVLDERHVAIPDLNGNNLIDSLSAVVVTGRAGLLFVVPGRDETLRLNGAAWVSTDADLLSSFSAAIRTPKVALVVRADEVFIHCAKAFRRGRVWDPDAWAELAGAPDGIEILCEQRLVDVDPEAVRGALERGYAEDLAADRP